MRIRIINAHSSTADKNKVNERQKKNKIEVPGGHPPFVHICFSFRCDTFPFISKVNFSKAYILNCDGKQHHPPEQHFCDISIMHVYGLCGARCLCLRLRTFALLQPRILFRGEVDVLVLYRP